MMCQIAAGILVVIATVLVGWLVMVLVRDRDYVRDRGQVSNSLKRRLNDQPPKETR